MSAEACNCSWNLEDFHIWSSWYPLLVKGGDSKKKFPNTWEAINSWGEQPAIYCLAVTTGGQKVPTYIGRTKHLSKRLGNYANDLSHLNQHIGSEAGNGFWDRNPRMIIWMRFFRQPTLESAKRAEEIILQSYNFLWNKQLNVEHTDFSDEVESLTSKMHSLVVNKNEASVLEVNAALLQDAGLAPTEVRTTLEKVNAFLQRGKPITGWKELGLADRPSEKLQKKFKLKPTE